MESKSSGRRESIHKDVILPTRDAEFHSPRRGIGSETQQIYHGFVVILGSLLKIVEAVDKEAETMIFA